MTGELRVVKIFYEPAQLQGVAAKLGVVGQCFTTPQTTFYGLVYQRFPHSSLAWGQLKIDLTHTGLGQIATSAY